MLESVREKLDNDVLKTIAKEVDSATNTITAEPPLVQLRDQIAGRLGAMLGRQHGLAPTFGFNSTDPRQLIQALRLFMDEGRRRQVADTSLGLANVLYLSLLLLQTEELETSLVTAASILGIEEPEAHLHPQMQRIVFRDLLRRKRPVLVSTHSPNIASVAPIESLVVLRGGRNGSTLSSFADATGFTDDERRDLERYLDVTRAELVFGRGVILVEGDAEKFVVPAAAAIAPSPIVLDEYGVSICSVAGTDFVPYAKLLKALEIPFVVITDGDERDGVALPPGLDRGVRILDAIGHVDAADVKTAFAAQKFDEVREALAAAGVFVGTRTLETDLLTHGAGPRMKDSFKAIFPTSRDATSEPFDAKGTVADEAEDALISLVERAGKGRFAQSFAGRMTATDVPSYLGRAIEAIVTICRRV